VTRVHACCNNYDEVKQYTVAGFEELLARFAEIRDYCSTPRGHECYPNIFLTGGEAFLYKSVSRDGIATLYEVIEEINRMMPRAKIIVKTGGFWQARKYQCALLDRIVHEYRSPSLNFGLDSIFIRIRNDQLSIGSSLLLKSIQTPALHMHRTRYTTRLTSAIHAAHSLRACAD